MPIRTAGAAATLPPGEHQPEHGGHGLCLACAWRGQCDPKFGTAQLAPPSVWHHERKVTTSLCRVTVVFILALSARKSIANSFEVGLSALARKTTRWRVALTKSCQRFECVLKVQQSASSREEKASATSFARG